MLSGLRQTLRALLRRPAFTAAALVTVALGVGANTAVFSIVHAVLLDPLPFREPQRLVQIWETHPELHNLQVAYPDFADWQASVRTLSLAAYTFQAINKITLLGEGEPQQIQASMASAELLPMLGIEPLRGRVYTVDEDARQRPVALISEALWRSKFSANPATVGKQIRLEQTSFTVVGIVPQRQAFPEGVEVWLPLSYVEAQLKTTRSFHPLEVIGRLQPGVKLPQAQAELDGVASRLAAEYAASNRSIGAMAVPLDRQIAGDVRPTLLMLWSAVGLVLLIVCANLAHLMMARALDRQREMAIRLAIGAGRAEVFRQILSESLLLALTGGALGIALAAALTPLLRDLARQRIPRADHLALDLPVLGFALAISALTGVLFGLPAWWQLRKADLNGVIKSGTVSSSGRRSAAGVILMASEVALSVVVLFGAALMIRSFERTMEEAPGVRTDNVVALEVSLPNARYVDWAKCQQFFDSQLAPRLRAIPGVTSVAASNTAPWSLGRTEHMRFATRFGVEGKSYDPGHFPVIQARWISEDYFSVLGLPLRSGRLLNSSDLAPGRVVINETMARAYFPGQNAVGKRIRLGVMSPSPASLDVVGVVGDVREFALDRAPEATYYSLAVSPRIAVLIKTAHDPSPLIAAILGAVRSADPELPVTSVRTLNAMLAASLARQQFVLGLLSVFAALAAFLAATGIYGVAGYAVSRRSREFGIRSAIGARPGTLLAMVIRESLSVTVPGIVAGVVLALVFSRFMDSMLYKVTAADPLSCAAVAALVLLLSIVSVWIPARRASAADPASALRG